MKRRNRDRCDRCKKWVHEGSLYTLEGIVSEGFDANFAICQQCLDKYSSANWEKWTAQDIKVHPEFREKV